MTSDYVQSFDSTGPVYPIKFLLLQTIRIEDSLIVVINTIDGESYTWEKVREFREFSHSRETFPPIHFKFHWNQLCIVGIAKLFHQYAK